MEDQTRAAMLGQTIKNVVYVLDHGEETMYLCFKEFALELKPIPGEYPHLAHRKVELNEVPNINKEK